jgi:hypothetical protein
VKYLACLIVAIFSAAALTAVPLSGCAASGADPVTANAVSFYQTEAVYTSAVRTMTTLVDGGQASLAQAERFETARVSAARLLDEWRASVIAGRPFNGMDSLYSILDELVRIQLASE